QVSRKTLAGILFAVLLTIATAIFLPSSAVQADPETGDLAAETTVVEEEGEASDADKAVLALKKPPKPELEPQPEMSTDKATATDLDLREAQLNYDWAKQKADLTSRLFRSRQTTQLSALEAKAKLEMAEIQLERAKRRIAGGGNVVGGAASSTYPEPRRIVDDAEKQRIADTAWRMLGLELEEVGRDQLGKVSQQYRGGLRCINVDHRTVDIREGDVLLGLHRWETATLEDLGYILSLPNVSELSPMKCYLLRNGKVYHTRLSVAVRARAQPRQGGRSGTVRGGVATRATQRALGGDKKGPRPGVGQSDEGAKQLAAVDKSSLHYDGKSFGLWRKVWRRELNPERRTDAIRAFATFAKNGYGREAAEAIVEIMRNYDCYAIDSSPTGKLKEAAIEALTSIDPKVCDPVLIAALKSSDRNAMILAIHVISVSRVDVETFVPMLRQLVENKENDRRVRAMAINALSTNQASEETQQLLFDAINDDDPMIAQSAIQGIPVAGALIRDYNPYIARLIDAMGRSDGSVRQAAYRALGSLGPASKPAVPALVKTLLENKDTGEFPMIIAALTRIGTAAEEAVPALVEL
ncbi:MAG: HEAT repeat domain-containing protein, partial [Pirellulales bacterium]